MESAGYSEKSLKTLQEMKWLMRVPETLAEAKRLVKEIDQSEMTELTAGHLGKEIKSEYGNVAQRWLIVFSQAAYNREIKTLTKSQVRE